MRKKKKILHIEDFFHPDAGYQLNILAKYLASENFDVTILTAEFDKIPNYLTDFFGRDHIEARDQAYENKYGVHIIRLPLRHFISGRAIYGTQIWDKIEEVAPDLLYVHGCDTYIGIQVLKRAGKLKCKIVSDNHMLDVASSNSLRTLFRKYYKMFVVPKIIKYAIPVIRVVDDDYVSKRLGIPKKYAPLVNFGSDLMLFHPDSDTRQAMREKYHIGEKTTVFCYAGKLDEHKGGLILARAIKEKLKADAKVCFVIVGNVSGEYGKLVEKTFQESENTIVRFPTQRYEELAKFYQMSDIAVFPRACSLSFYDVQACGLPVILENIAINIERCTHKNGITFESGSVEGLRKAMEYMVNLKQDSLDAMKENAIAFIEQNYNYNHILKEYLNIFEEKYE